LYGPDNSAWPQYRHDYKRTGYYVWPANCASITHMYDVVHGSIDEGIIGQDANGDGGVDIIGTQQSSSVYGVMAVDGITGDTLWENRMDYFAGPGIASAAASRDKVFANGYAYFSVLDLSTGATIYQYNKPDARDASPAIADVDGDGCPEVYTAFGTEAVAIDGCASTYTALWLYSLPAAAYAPALGDIDGDGLEEVLYPLANGEIYVLDALTGTLHSSFSAGVPSSLTLYPDYTIALGDVDGDGKDEVAVPTPTSIAVYKYRGFIFGWVNMWSVGGFTDGSPVALADKDGDGLVDVWMNHGGDLYIYKGLDGTLLANTSGLGVNGGDGLGYPPTLVDLTGDFFPDVLEITNDYYVSLLDGLSLTSLGSYGPTPYSITSEVIVLKLGGSLAFAVGDYSCHINAWGTCPLGYDDPTDVSEKPDVVSTTFKYENGKLLVGASAPTVVSIYDRSGRTVMSVRVEGTETIDLRSLSKGVYIVKVGDGLHRIVIR